MKGQLRIDHLYAFIVVDDDGTEGVIAVTAPDGFILPLMGADMARIDSMRQYVNTDPRLTGKTITLAKFSQRDNLEVIDRTTEERRRV